MFFKDKKVLVAGGTGFVGGYFVEELLDRGALVRVTVHHRPPQISHSRLELARADLMKQEDCQRVCRGMDCVIHAAGSVSGAAVTSGANPMNGITVGVSLAAQLLQASWSEKVGRFLLFSSSAGYPPVEHAVREEEFWEGSPHPSYFGYGWMRRYLERLGELTHRQSSTKVAIVRPTAIYGERDNFDLQTSHVIPGLIRRAVATENPLVVWGSGRVVRDFIHVRDLILGSLLVLEKHAVCDPVNIGCGQPISIEQIVREVLEAAGRADAKIVFDESKPTTIPYRLADISKARQLGYAPTILLKDGLKRTADWYRSKFTKT